MSAAHFDFHRQIAEDAISQGRAAVERHAADNGGDVRLLLQARAWLTAAKTNVAHAETALRRGRPAAKGGRA